MIFLKNLCYGYSDTSLCNIGLNMLGQFAIGLATTPLQAIIHESGHAIAACILHKNANPKIELINYGYSSSTLYNIVASSLTLASHNIAQN